MEKTLAFAIQEALESGRRSANASYIELEIKEKIIQELESLQLPVNPSIYNQAINDAIFRIRGDFAWNAKLAKRKEELGTNNEQ